MKRSMKITSALVVLALLLAQVVSVGAATTTSYNVTFTSQVKNGAIQIDVQQIADAESYGAEVNGKDFPAGSGQSITVSLSDISASSSTRVRGYIVVSGKKYFSAYAYLNLSAPSISYSVKQTDHYIKTVTASVSGGNGITSIKLEGYKYQSDASPVAGYTASAGDVSSISMEVRPSEVSYVKIIAVDKTGREIVKWCTVGSNGYYNGNSGSNNNYNDSNVWDGVVSGNSSSSNNNGTVVWDYGDGWTGYYEEDDSASSLSTTYYVTCRSLNVRKGPGTRYSKAGSVRRGDAVQVYNIEDGWAVIEYRGSLRYVSSRYLSR